MFRIFVALLGLVLMSSGVLSAASDLPPLPKTLRKPVTETYHGIKVTDPYRWLENAASPAVQEWTRQENAHTRAFLDRLAALKPLRARLTDLLGHASPGYGSLQLAGGVLFAMKSQPPREQPFLVTLPSVDNPAGAIVLVDPNTLGSKGKTSIDFYAPSHDGHRVAVSLSENGTEEGTLYIYDVPSRKRLPDVIPRVQYPTAGGDVAWNADNSGFYYTRYPRGNERPKADLNFYEHVYFHKLGTPTEEDTYVLGKDFPRIAEIFLDSSPDGRYLLATVQKGDGGEFQHYLKDPQGHWTQLTSYADKVSTAVFDPGQPGLYLLSTKNSPRGEVLWMPLNMPRAEPRVVAPPSDTVIQGFRFGANRLYPSFVATDQGIYVVDIKGGPSGMRYFTRQGKLVQDVPIEPISSVREALWMRGNDVLIHSETYLHPPAWFAFQPGKSHLKRTALYRTSPADFGDDEVVREFATSRDGTKVPLNILMTRGTKRDRQNPTLLTGYGGFGISMSPSFSPARKAWLEQGGVYVIANLRGGAEYGEAWHEAGNLTHKQNVFDDFAAVAEHLIQRRYTSRDRLAIEGGSNGGLLMGAALTQHPELFRAVVSHVGIYDMLRFERFPNGVFNVTEYGSIANPEQFKALLAYSPYQHVKKGTPYPAVFLLTGANDGRVDPANSRKMAARLQADTSSGRPILLLVDYGSGHGIGDSLSHAIHQSAEVDAFLFDQLGVKYDPKK